MIARFALAMLALPAAACASTAPVAASKPMACEIGPIKKIYGGTPWLVYSCADGRSAVIVSDEGNPASPFYFMFSVKPGDINLVGEGTGSKIHTSAAFEDLKKLTPADIESLVLETKTVVAN